MWGVGVWVWEEQLIWGTSVTASHQRLLANTPRIFYKVSHYQKSVPQSEKEISIP